MPYSIHFFTHSEFCLRSIYLLLRLDKSFEVLFGARRNMKFISSVWAQIEQLFYLIFFFTEVACRWRRLTSRCWTSRTRTLPTSSSGSPTTSRLPSATFLLGTYYLFDLVNLDKLSVGPAYHCVFIIIYYIYICMYIIYTCI